MPIVLLLSCPDRPGVVAATAEFIVSLGGNILHAEQHVDSAAGGDVFFQRIEFDVEDVTTTSVEQAIAELAAVYAMRVQVHRAGRPVPTAILASRQPHCLYDLLTRWRSGELPMDLRVVISNHPDHAEFCGHLGIEHLHLPVTPDTRAAQEREVLAALDEHGVELVVMARYMQILSDEFIRRHPMRIINIHHSFLPAFVGADPYRQAHQRGVKLIGATAHYATADLDEGPIIEQDTVHVSHRDDVARLTAKGRDLETVVLARAVRAHLEHRVLVNGGRTIVFS